MPEGDGYGYRAGALTATAHDQLWTWRRVRTEGIQRTAALLQRTVAPGGQHRDVRRRMRRESDSDPDYGVAPRVQLASLAA